MADQKETKKVDNVDEDSFFKDVLDDPEDEDKEVEKQGDSEKSDNEEEAEEEKKRSQKNKDAEEARKRREAEEKAKKEEEAKLAKEKAEAEKKAKAKEDQTQTLGKQLEDFKNEYPDVDLEELDKNKPFKKFINGKLLGKQNFTELYRDYVEFTAELSGKSKEDIEAGFAKKAHSSSGSSTSKTGNDNEDVYSEKEFQRLTQKLPYMTDEDAEKIMDKFQRSSQYYAKK